jgi:hypothetical protein
MGVPIGVPADCGTFTARQRLFLEHHRDEVFLRAQVRRCRLRSGTLREAWGLRSRRPSTKQPVLSGVCKATRLP